MTLILSIRNISVKIQFIISTTSGSAILKILLGCYLFGWGLYTFQIILLIVEGKYKDDCSNYNIFSYVKIFFIRYVLHSIAGLCLWLGYKKKSRSFLIIHIFFEFTLSVFYIIKIINLARCSVGDSSVITHHKIGNFVIKTIHQIAQAFEMYIVYKCYKKLGSPFITRLKQRSLQIPNKYERQQSTESIGENENHKLEANVISTSDGKKLHRGISIHVINPLDIAIDTSIILGEGQFGQVVKGVLLKDGLNIPVAVKTVKNSKEELLEAILNEIRMLAYIGRHENIVEFLGIVSDASIKDHCAIITEFCAGGSLQTFLTSSRHTFINLLNDILGNDIYSVMFSGSHCIYVNLDEHGTHSTLDLINFAYEIANGMKYLASQRIVHGDLAARNVLLTKDKKVKLTDFGLSHRLYNYQLYRRLENENTFLPWRYMSIEAIEDLKFSEASDIWSFAVVLWEIFTLGDIPYSSIPNCPEDGNLIEIIRNCQIHLNQPKYAPVEIYELMKLCWETCPEDRPNFSEIKDAIRDMLIKWSSTK